jgi:hypothetical protein
VFENRVLRRTIGFQRKGVRERSRKLYASKIHNLYSSLNNVRMIKSRMVRLTGHVAYMGDKRNACRVLMGKAGRKGPL